MKKIHQWYEHIQLRIMHCKTQKFEINGRAKTTFRTSFYYYVVQLLCKTTFILQRERNIWYSSRLGGCFFSPKKLCIIRVTVAFANMCGDFVLDFACLFLSNQRVNIKRRAGTMFCEPDS